MNQVAIIKRATGPRAAQCAVMLVAKYPAMKLENPDVFMTDLRNLIQGYPDEILERALVHIPKVVKKWDFEIASVKMELDNLARPVWEKLKLQKEAIEAAEKREGKHAEAAVFRAEAQEWLKVNPGKKLREMMPQYRKPQQADAEAVQRERSPLMKQVDARLQAAGEGAVLRAGLGVEE